MRRKTNKDKGSCMAGGDTGVLDVSQQASSLMLSLSKINQGALR